MGKKAKIGKQRKDKYYQLAKETGFRSRSAFKLIQLNRKFGFLQKSRVLVDLCAAPGGWMQVAKKNMPVSSVVIGVDLFPIKSVPGCIGLIEDITTEKCKQSLQRELKTWKADVVLHDGAPNVGMNWIYDAHQQSLLTLNAAKLASQFLRNGGWFISKIFRSRDYNAIIWILKQLFKKVHSTKPQASRAESAEIFVVCQGFLAPDKLDARFFDPKHVFEELEVEPKSASSVFHPEKQKKAKAEGYPEGMSSMHKVMPVSLLILSENPVEILQVATQLSIDNDAISNHPKTTDEIRACLKDIKVLGRKDLRLLMNWCTAMKPVIAPPEPEPAQEANADDEDEDEDAQIAKQLAEMKESERKELKRKKKAVLKERRKLQERLNLKMVVKGDDGPKLTDGDDMFTLKSVTSTKVLKKLEDQSPDDVLEEDEDEESGEVVKKRQAYDPKQSHLDSSGTFYKETDSEASDGEEDPDATNLHRTPLEEGLGLSDSELSFEADSDEASGDEDGGTGEQPESHPLLTDLDHRTKTQRRVQRAQLWFQKDVFQDLETEADEDLELDALAIELKGKGGKILGPDGLGSEGESDEESNEGEEGEIEDSGDDSGSDYEMPLPSNKRKATEKTGKSSKHAGFEVMPKETPLKRIKLNAEGLALGAMIATSHKNRRGFEDAGWNRNAFNDEHLPDWFTEDENKHNRKELPVTKEMVEELKKRAQELDARPIKKVIEANARKKKRAVRRLEKAKKKVEALMESSEVSEQEKARQIKQLYKKASGKKPEIKYVVSKKHTTSKRARRPPGLKGPYKVVDPRMKKDTRGIIRADKKRGKGGKGAKGSKGGNKKGGSKQRQGSKSKGKKSK